MITQWDLVSKCSQLNEEERKKYLATFNEFTLFCNFEKIRFQYNSIVLAVISFLDTVLDPLDKRIQLEVFFGLLEFKTNNPASDIRVMNKCKQLFQLLENNKQKRSSKGSINSISKSPVKKKSMQTIVGNKSSATTANGNTLTNIPVSGNLVNCPVHPKVITWYDQMNAIPNLSFEDKNNISEFLKFFEDNKIDLRVSYTMSVQHIIQYFDHWIKTIGINSAVLKRKAASLIIFYKSLTSKHLCTGNPLLHSEVSKYIAKLENDEKSTESLHQPISEFDISSSDTSVDINEEHIEREHKILIAKLKEDELELLELELELEIAEFNSAKWNSIHILMENNRYKEFVTLIERQDLW